MRVAYQDCFHLIEPLLAKVEKPSRYIDHEWGTLSKADADYRCCLIYPDVYEVGLPNQGIAILYNILNQAEGISCERGYVPWPDMGDGMREAGIPLLSLEGAAPVASFDIVGLHVPHEMAVTNFLEALDLAGIPLLAADRTEDDPIIIAGGPSVYNPEPYAAFFDAILIGEGEESLLETCQLHRRLRDEGVPRAQIVEQLASIAGNYVPSLYEVRPARRMATPCRARARMRRPWSTNASSRISAPRIRCRSRACPMRSWFTIACLSRFCAAAPAAVVFARPA